MDFKMNSFDSLIDLNLNHNDISVIDVENLPVNLKKLNIYDNQISAIIGDKTKPHMALVHLGLGWNYLNSESIYKVKNVWLPRPI